MLFTGAECSGKSSLANSFGFLVVDEYVREFIDAHRRDTTYDDVDPIAKEQLHRENVARSSGEPLVIFDTNLSSATCFIAR